MDVDNVKPTGLVIGAALIMLALGKPLTGSRAFGGASFALPQMGDCKAMVSPSRSRSSAVVRASTGQKIAVLHKQGLDGVACVFVVMVSLKDSIDYWRYHQRHEWQRGSWFPQGFLLAYCVQAESKVMAERKGKGLHLSIKQLNAVLRL